MKYLTTLYDLNNINNLSLTVDGFILGNERFGTRLTHSFTIDEINQAIKLAVSLDKEIFLQANQMLDDELLDQFSVFLDQLDTNNLNGIIVADIGSVMRLKSKNLSNKAIYNPETLLTNKYDFNFLKKDGIFGAYVAKEITLSDVLEISEHKEINLFMVGHGHLNMFYSKRQLINNFMDYQNQDNIFHNQQNLKIIEEQRSDEPYPILEDMAGTHVFRSKVFSSLEYIEQLENHVDYLVIDSIFKDDLYAKKVSELYKNKSINKKLVKDIKALYKEDWDSGFFYKKTVYKTKES
ncbi:MAG: U32 family peptidase [Acholeplasmataceae bacterium]|nr:U32 family peptidase [Acholeplasmataceae bacterium]